MRFMIGAVVLAAGLVVSSANAALAGPATAPTTTPATAPGNLTTGNWSGYYAIAPSTHVLAVEAQFTVPKVSCSQGWGSYPRAVALWAGIGGLPQIDGANVRLEQDGLLIQCDWPWSKPQYRPVWEVYKDNGPQFWTDSHGKDITVQPGDLLQVNVEAPGSGVEGHPNQYTFEIADFTSDGYWTQYFTLPTGQNPGTTAEVITEWPTLPDHLGFGNGGLLNAGTVRYIMPEFCPIPGSDAACPPITEYSITLKLSRTTVLYPTEVNPWPEYGDFTTQYTGKF